MYAPPLDDDDGVLPSLSPAVVADAPANGVVVVVVVATVARRYIGVGVGGEEPQASDHIRDVHDREAVMLLDPTHPFRVLPPVIAIPRQVDVLGHGVDQAQYDRVRIGSQ